MKLSITARLALLAIGLALISSLALAGFVWQATQDDAIGELRRDTIEQSDALFAVWQSGGAPALGRAIAAAQEGDDTLVAELVDGTGARIAGVGPEHLSFAPAPGATGFRIERLGTSGPWAAEEAGFVVRQLGNRWLVSGRMLDDWERAQRTIERALVLAVILAVLLGIAGGLVLTRYVSRRLDHIAGAVDAVTAGDLGRRVATSGGDAFDRLGGRINQMLDRIDGLVGELRVVTDSIAHDLRSPIARLRARADTALAAADSGQRDAALAGLIAETDLVTRMLGVLLEISRTEAASRDAFAPLEPATLIEEIADLYEPVAEEAGLSFDVATAPDIPAIPLHRELLSQAVANLIDNAMRHAGGGGAIALSLGAGEGELQIAVADRGPGIAEADRAEALRRFGRLDSARSLPGAGLGLALADAVARLHRGRLELGDNAPGLVATLVLPFPI
ncbi:HAMP domain-containing histidine kinase [Sphingomonas sp. LB-2]|uniref:sensor histidine kinase n=1 Tax=Sphingomonas caeni TaxID=2984949 RepID=UPI00222FE141|nr:HAMP domain-containing sensor histidine kinase [Sphingomonas caeni]MCW3845785.1 HAMP domain-containing histidine kinase [Sphingomonas caeni]